MKILLIYKLIHATGDTDNLFWKWNVWEEILALHQQKTWHSWKQNYIYDTVQQLIGFGYIYKKSSISFWYLCVCIKMKFHSVRRETKLSLLTFQKSMASTKRAQ